MKYVKKPVVVDACKLIYENFSSPDVIPDFVKEELDKDCSNLFIEVNTENKTVKGTINTLEGKLTAEEGCYLIKGIKGEFYPCAADIFEATYERYDK